ncbi:hypothetical protein AGABI2DRAFT_148600 [Agaricus bisporus var. bisporus H97]|uniref:hypothetical protein n=1 Tax=Agaricus bisporus var. bisporus (strain H97 / ATCC MYA-4626 / FGSC 10389) TaxID=936046 RepID=UPI00029F525D|nr:hypothetical protein AGABI2DRAFT_148600 [Agaricus bisporus var. bisporus H97]EKV50060.1 hypothetical protein AGABI2DRAFT_148600 [Agaricus bisporus var. bisporus H97]
MPNPLSAGHLHLNFPTHPPPPSQYALSLLRPSQFPLAVIGIASFCQTSTLKSIYSQFNAALLDIFPASNQFPLARTCFVFEENDIATNLSASNDLPGVVIIPSMMGNKRLYIGTLLADLCSQILGEFGVVMQALESPFGNEYLNGSLLAALPPLSELPLSLDSDRRGSVPNFSSPDVLKSDSASTSIPPMKRNSSSGPNYRLGVQPPKKRLSTIGVASSHARLYKMLGDFFLLAGRTEDSTIWYTEALQLFKNSQDHAWHAAVLEGLATISVVEAWSAGHGLHNSTTSSKEPWSDAIEKLTQATTLYHKSPLYYEGESIYAPLAYLYSCCVLRHSSLLFAVWSAKGWGPLAFTTMLQPGPKAHLPPTLAHDEADQWLNLERLTKYSGISRSSISNVLGQIHGPWLLHLHPRERLSILTTMASVYACLGYKRKEAYLLREVLGCVMDLIVCGREEDGITKVSGPRNTGLGIENGNITPTNPLTYLDQGSVAVRMSESSLGNDSVLRILKQVCKTIGIDLDAVKLLHASTQETELAESSQNEASTNDDGSELERPETYGWPELQVGVVREAVAVAEALPDFPAVAQFALSSLKTLQTVLSPGDQHHLYSTSMRAITTARRRGDSRFFEYWSGRPVVSVALAPVPLVRLPVEKHLSVLSKQKSDLTPIIQGITDPFLYNPRRVTAKKDQEIVAQNEVLEFVVVLQNPFIFDLELQCLSLSTSGVKFQSEPVRVVLPASSFHQVVIPGKVMATGILTIRGCFVQAPGGITQEFILPLNTAEEEERITRRKSALICEAERYKYWGLESLPWEKPKRSIKYHSSQLNPRTNLRFLECKVVPEQPLLRIRRTSVNHGALMLYEGERSTLRITLENISLLPIDFVHLAFDDSTIEPAQQALAEGAMSSSDVYETEHSLINQPVFTWNKSEGRFIPPGHTLSLSISCFGKSGCTNGNVHVSYSYTHRTDLEQPSDYFYTRQLSHPIMVTVYPMLQCQNMDLIPFPSYMDYIQTPSTTTHHNNLGVDDGASWCLFSVEVRNVYGSPFEVTFEREQYGTSHSSTTTTIPPGSTSRVVLPLRRTALSEEDTSKPIPTLSDRQFVVAKDKLSTAELHLQRELFWYREALFKSIQGYWKEVGGTRTGEMSLRQQRMTLPMLEAFKSNVARVDLSLISCDLPKENTIDGRRVWKANEFLKLKVRITNLSSFAIPLSLTLDLEPSDCLIYEGVIADIPIGRLDEGMTREIEFPICFLTNGHFELVAQVRAVGFDIKPAKAEIIAAVRS